MSNILVTVVTSQHCMKCCTNQLRGAIVACTFAAEVELAPTLAALLLTISEMDD